MPFDNLRPSKSLDFGREGFTGSLSIWHELLQLTVPDEQCGVVFVRGDYPDNAESILARAQRRNNSGTFGLEIHIPEEANFVLERTSAQGMINLRWPFTKFNFVEKDSSIGSVSFATYTICSFIKDKTLYQIVRVAPQSTSAPDSALCNGSIPESVIKSGLDLNIGGTIRLGCCCSDRDSSTFAGRTATFHDIYTTPKPPDGVTSYIMYCESAYHERRLEIRLWVNGKPMELNHNPVNAPSRIKRPGDGDEEGQPHAVEILRTVAKVEWTKSEPITAVASFSLVDSKSPISFQQVDMMRSADIRDYLGFSDTSINAPYRLWSNVLHQTPGLEAFDLNVVGRTVENILGLSSVPIHIESAITPHPNTTVPVDLSPVQVSPAASVPPGDNQTAPGIWRRGSRPEIAHLSQKRKESSTKDKNVALLKNIIAGQVVDLESVL